ncbi:hypothetical protein [Acetivibrio clariflavus]|uniref:hypothetical protein n=1 Tax=Acetivibrio clariflavus TaxID=288965 RepID=UPI0031F56468
MKLILEHMMLTKILPVAYLLLSITQFPLGLVQNYYKEIFLEPFFLSTQEIRYTFFRLCLGAVISALDSHTSNNQLFAPADLNKAQLLHLKKFQQEIFLYN